MFYLVQHYVHLSIPPSFVSIYRIIASLHLHLIPCDFYFAKAFQAKQLLSCLGSHTHTHNTAKAAICWPVHHRHIRVELINGTSQLDTFGKTLTRGISIYTIFDILRRKEIISCNERTFHISSVDTEISSNDAKPKKWHIVDMTRVLHF